MTITQNHDNINLKERFIIHHQGESEMEYIISALIFVIMIKFMKYQNITGDHNFIRFLIYLKDKI